MVVYELSGWEFESGCRHLKFRYCTCFEKGFPWCSGNYRVQMHSKTRMWHDKNTQSMHLIDKYSKYGSIIWLVWLYSWVFVYELNVIANDVLKMREVIKFQSSGIVIYYKIHFRVLLQSFCAGEVSVVIVTDK